MKGKRVYPQKEGQLFLAEGEYGMDNDGVWYARPPGMHVGSLSNHDITEHLDDKTITVSPSILIKSRNNDGPVEWHGYLERGIWREC